VSGLGKTSCEAAPDVRNGKGPFLWQRQRNEAGGAVRRPRETFGWEMNDPWVCRNIPMRAVSATFASAVKSSRPKVPESFRFPPCFGSPISVALVRMLLSAASSQIVDCRPRGTC